MKRAFGLLAALILGVSLAACGNTSTSTEAAGKGVTDTVVKTKTVTPQSCIDALDAAEALVHGPVVASTRDEILLASQIQKALIAGSNQDLYAAQQIVHTVQGITARTKQRTQTIKRLVATYNTASSDCRSH